MQQVVDAAAALGRKVALVGRSMRKNVEHRRARSGTSRCPRGCSSRRARSTTSPTSKLVDHLDRVAGRAAVARCAGWPTATTRQVELHEGDTVVFSATPIPGNERAVNETIDRLYHIGCDVITTRDAPIHASGHGYAEEIKLMLNLTKPRYVMPFHGDYKRIHLHARARRGGGHRRTSAIFQGENGLPLEIDDDGARFGASEQAGMIFVDGVDIGDLADVALRDRRMLSADGIFIVVATISEQDGRSVAEPEVIFRGVPFLDEADELLDEIRETRRGRRSSARPRRRSARSTSLQEQLHDDLAAFVYERLKRRPMVLPVVVEV